MRKPLLVLAAGAAASLAAAAPAPAAPLFATDTNNRLVSFDSERPERASAVRLRGLPSGVSVKGLDMRPLTGQLWLLGSDSKLYTTTRAGKVTAVSQAPFATPLRGTSFGFDFNPMVDRIRIVSDAEQNLRANPFTGGLVQADGDLNPGNPTVTAAAYTNSGRATAQAASTVLYVIDAKSGTLFTQNPPNAGGLAEPKNLTTKLPVGLQFDVVGAQNTAFVAGRRSAASRTELFRLDVATGQMRRVGRIGVGTRLLTGLTGR
jgi:hypothetical protein